MTLICNACMGCCAAKCAFVQNCYECIENGVADYQCWFNERGFIVGLVMELVVLAVVLASIYNTRAGGNSKVWRLFSIAVTACLGVFHVLIYINSASWNYRDCLFCGTLQIMVITFGSIYFACTLLLLCLFTHKFLCHCSCPPSPLTRSSSFYESSSTDYRFQHMDV